MICNLSGNIIKCKETKHCTLEKLSYLNNGKRIRITIVYFGIFGGYSDSNGLDSSFLTELFSVGAGARKVQQTIGKK